MDFDWIEEYEKSEEEYNDFYKTQVESIQILFLYINKDNELFHVKSEKMILSEGQINKENILFTLRKNMIHNEVKFLPISLLKYNIDLDVEDVKKYIMHDDYPRDFLTPVKYTSGIEWNDTISLFQDLNCLYVFFKERNTKINTKKIHIKPKRKTRRKYI